MTAFVLIPGIGCGSWAWQPVARRLTERGHRALPLTLPGLGFADDHVDRGAHSLDGAVDFVVAAVDAWSPDEPVTLVGHSWGGYPLSGAAVHLGATRIHEVVYVNAAVPQRDVPFRAENADRAAAIDAQLERGDTIWVSPDDVAMGMMQDEAPAAQQIVSDLVVPTPGRYFTDALRTPPVTDVGIPARYLLGTADRALARPGAEFAARLGVRPQTIDGSHMSIFTRPEPVARHLCHRPSQPVSAG